jgi:hypothetical protein
MSYVNEKPTAGRSEIDKLISELSSKEKNTRENARHSLALIGKPAIKPLVEAMLITSRGTHMEIVKALIEMLNPETAPALVKQLENEDPEVRWLASEGLITLGRKALEPLLTALISRPDSLPLRMGGHHVLADLYAGEVHESETTFEPLYRLNDELRKAIRPVLIAMESMDHSVLIPTTGRKALAEVTSIIHAEI